MPADKTRHKTLTKQGSLGHDEFVVFVDVVFSFDGGKTSKTRRTSFPASLFRLRQNYFVALFVDLARGKQKEK